MESPSKRIKMSSSTFDSRVDYVPLGIHDDEAIGARNGDGPTHLSSGGAHGRHTHSKYPKQDVNDQYPSSRHGGRHREDDKPKSKHALPGHEPWILVKTKLRRRFVHNTETKQSYWRVPPDVLPGVLEFERWERDQAEKAQNMKWAEDQLKQMRNKSQADEINKAADDEGRRRRRRSESLQREDEEALMAELAAQAEQDEEEDVKETVKAVEDIRPRQEGPSYDSDSSYEEVEVTDSEFEDDADNKQTKPVTTSQEDPDIAERAAEDEPMEFGEDDIAYQLAAMDDQYGLDAEEYGEGEQDWEGDADGLALGEEDAVNLFRDLLDDYRISPFTPWEKLIADESETSILNDDRYTVLNSTRARKEAWESWVRDRAAEIKRSRETMEKQDPKIPYLAFLQDKATLKLYWPEFKRKYKREPEMNERKLSDKDREKLYRDHITRLKLPETSRKADLQSLLKSIPPKLLNRTTSLDSLPQPLLSHLHYISLPPLIRDPIIESFVQKLPEAPNNDDLTAEEQLEDERKRERRARQEKAMADRERRVEDDRRRNEREVARARRDLQDGEREIQRAMAVNNRGPSS